MPGINLEEDSNEEAAVADGSDLGGQGHETSQQPQVRPSLFEVFMALKEREK